MMWSLCWRVMGEKAKGNTAGRHARAGAAGGEDACGGEHRRWMAAMAIAGVIDAWRATLGNGGERVAGAGGGIVQWLIRQLFAPVLIVALRQRLLQGLSKSRLGLGYCSLLVSVASLGHTRHPLPSPFFPASLLLHAACRALRLASSQAHPARLLRLS